MIVILINVQSSVFILLDIDIPIRLVFNNVRRCLDDVFESPRFETVGFGVINRSGRIVCFGIGGN